MIRSLSTQLALAGGLLFLLLASVMLAWNVTSYQRMGEEVEQRLHRSLAAHIVYDTPSLKQGQIIGSELKDAFHTMMLLGPEWEIYALDLKGKLLAYSAAPGKVVRQQVSLQPIHAFFEGAAFPLYGDDPRSRGGKRIFSAAPINLPSGEMSGYLYVVIGGEQWQNLSAMLGESQQLRQGLMLMGTTLLFGFGLLLCLLVLFTKPLKRLIAQLRLFVKQGFAEPELLSAKDSRWSSGEVKELQQCCSEMAQHITEQFSQIKNTDQLRRELVSHVSHDFRTPLAALQGYLETWLLQQAEQRQDRYIEIALNNAQQLDLLVEQLFELARLESGDSQLHPEIVDLKELAKELLQRTGLLAESKGVQLLLEAPEPAALVTADIAKLERILLNLLDNAIRHTPSGGKVILQLSEQNGKIKVSVSDTGMGIPESELALLFQPYYQASNSQAASKHHGLGLAIVKRLVELHGGEVEVQNRQPQGASFSFLLEGQLNISLASAPRLVTTS